MSLIIKLKKHFKHVCLTKPQANVRERRSKWQLWTYQSYNLQIKYNLQAMYLATLLLSVRKLSEYLNWDLSQGYFKLMLTIKHLWASLVAQMVKNPPAMQETWVQSLGWEDPLEEDMATHSSFLTWRIPMDRGAW